VSYACVDEGLLRESLTVDRRQRVLEFVKIAAAGYPVVLCDTLCHIELRMDGRPDLHNLRWTESGVTHWPGPALGRLASGTGCLCLSLKLALCAIDLVVCSMTGDKRPPHDRVESPRRMRGRGVPGPSGVERHYTGTFVFKHMISNAMKKTRPSLREAEDTHRGYSRCEAFCCAPARICDARRAPIVSPSLLVLRLLI